MKIYLDTNVLIDFLSNRGVFTKFATEIFSLAYKSKIMLFTSTHVIATTHYILKKYTDDKELRMKLYELTDLIQIIDVTESTLKKALLSDFKDFEDGLQIFSAVSIGMVDYIVTRNLKDFKHSLIPAVAPDELLSIIDPTK
jgi:predicted nucleic acid-binding protein